MVYPIEVDCCAGTSLVETWAKDLHVDSMTAVLNLILPTFLSLAVQKSRRRPGIFSLTEWRKDRKDSRKGLIVRGYAGHRRAHRPKVPGNLHTFLASRRRLLYTPSIAWVCSQLNNMQPASSAHFLIMSCSCEKRYQASQALPIFPYCTKLEFDLTQENVGIHLGPGSGPPPFAMV